MDYSRFPENAAAALGERVRNRRIQGGLSEEAVARAMGCEIDHLRAAEAGEIIFTAENIVDLCPILRVVPSWFFDKLGE